MTWLERLKSEMAQGDLPTKPTKPGFVGFVGTPGGPIKNIEGLEAPATARTLEPEAPSKPSMTSAQADTYAGRLALFTDRDLSLEEGALLAIRMLTRDLDRDDRVVCLECAHLQRRHCGNYRRAGVAFRARDAQLPADFVRLLQRCDGFSAR